MKNKWRVGLTAVVVGLSVALLPRQDSTVIVAQNAQAQEEAAEADLSRSSPPDTTPYVRPLVPEDLSPGGLAPLGSETQALDSSGAVLGGAEPGIFIVDVVVNNTNPNLTINDTANDGETSIAVNPEDPDEIVITAFSGGWGANAPIYHSTDGGITWTRQFSVPVPPGWPGGCPCDWTWDYGRNDELSATILANSPTATVPGPPFEGDVVTGTTTDPSSSAAFNYFDPPLAPVQAQETNINVLASLGSVDQPWVLVNPDPFTPSQDNVYVAYDDFNNTDGMDGADLRVAVSYNLNPPNFTVDQQVGNNKGGGNPGLRLAKDPRTGIMWALYRRNTGAGDDDSVNIDSMLNRSTDGGVSWSLNTNAFGIVVANADSTQPTPKFGTVNALLGGVHHGAVDPNTGDLYYVYGDRDAATNNDRLSIRKISSDGAGGVVVGAQNFVTGQVEAAIPQVAVTDNGVVGVFYYTFDGFSSDDFPIFTAHLALSEDEGASFDNHELVTFLSSAKDSCPNDLPMEQCERQRVLGDYMQMQTIDNCFYGSFTANGAPFGRPMANHDPIFFKTCVGPMVQVPSDVSFGDVCGAAIETLEVCNTGTDNLVVESITPSDPQFTVATPSAGFPVTISPDFCFPFEVTFTPTGGGAAIADAEIVSNDPSSPTTVALSGNAPPPDINVAIANSGDFGDVCKEGQADLDLTLFNQGKCDLTISNIQLLPDAGSFELPADLTFPLVLSPDADFRAPIRFSPEDMCFDTPEARTVEITSDDPDEMMVTVDISGTSPCPNLVIDPVALDGIYAFPATVVDDTGTLGCFTDRSVVLRNNGACPLTIDSISAVGVSGDVADYAVTAPTLFPINLPAGEETLGVTVRFTPQADADPLAPSEVTGLMTVMSDDPDTDHTANLCGESVAQSGVRILVTELSSGTPVIVDVVDSIVIQSKGKNRPGPINLQFVDQSASFAEVCSNTINYHVDQETLPSTETTGSGPQSSYKAKAMEGNLQTSESFGLGQCEFREFQLELQDSAGEMCLLEPKGGSCTNDGECCSGKCKGPAGGKSCK